MVKSTKQTTLTVILVGLLIVLIAGLGMIVNYSFTNIASADVATVRTTTLNLTSASEDMDGAGENWTWTQATKTLTLNGVNFNLPTITNSDDANLFLDNGKKTYAAIAMPADSKIIVTEGTTNNITVGSLNFAPSQGQLFGIWTAGAGNFTIEGSGILNITVGDNLCSTNSNNYVGTLGGIVKTAGYWDSEDTGSLTIKDCKINIEIGDLKLLSNTGSQLYGISAGYYCDIIINNADIGIKTGDFIVASNSFYVTNGAIMSIATISIKDSNCDFDIGNVIIQDGLTAPDPSECDLNIEGIKAGTSTKVLESARAIFLIDNTDFVMDLGGVYCLASDDSEEGTVIGIRSSVDKTKEDGTIVPSIMMFNSDLTISYKEDSESANVYVIYGDTITIEDAQLLMDARNINIHQDFSGIDGYSTKLRGQSTVCEIKTNIIDEDCVASGITSLTLGSGLAQTGSEVDANNKMTYLKYSAETLVTANVQVAKENVGSNIIFRVTAAIPNLSKRDIEVYVDNNIVDADSYAVTIVENKSITLTGLSVPSTGSVSIKIVKPGYTINDGAAKVVYSSATDVGEYDRTPAGGNGNSGIKNPSNNEDSSNAGKTVGIVILVIVLLLLIAFVGLFFIWKKEFDNNNVESTTERKLKALDPVYKPINNLIFKKKD